MLFWAKSRPGRALVFLLVLGPLGWVLCSQMGLFETAPDSETFMVPVLGVGMGLLVLLVSDGMLQLALMSIFGAPYQGRLHALACYFEDQDQAWSAWFLGALLAGVEELIFRGILLNLMLDLFPNAAWLAIIVVAINFGLCHIIPNRDLAPFALWACWQGAILGLLYILIHSLLVVALIHIIHDSIGFLIFKKLRDTHANSVKSLVCRF